MNKDDAFPAVAVAVLLILTAWGNAIAMMIVSAVGLIIGLFLYRGRFLKGGLLAAAVACVVAFVIGILFMSGK